MACPGDDALAALVGGRLTSVQASEIGAHAAGCADCAELLEELGLALTASPERAGEGEPALAEGTHVGRYRTERELGRGGMGVVYLADDPVLGRRVAIKLLRGGDADARLVREAQALAALSHPNVAVVYDVGAIDGRAWIAMEHIDGVTLRRWRELAPRRWDEILDAYLQAGRGLAAAHEAGVVHRDFKPTNVMVGADGRVRVLDFGLARTDGGAAGPLSGSIVTTQTGALVGTPAYMAPEQMQRRPADARSDQFSFCVSLYEALWERRPFPGLTVEELRRAVLAGRVEPPPARGPVPRSVGEALLRGMRVAPEERFPSMAALLDALERGPRARRRARRGALLAAAVAAAAAAGWAVGPGRAPPACAGAGARVAEVWGPAQRRAVEAAFRATGVPYAERAIAAVETAFDGWARAWSEMAAEACVTARVKHEQSEAELAARTLCLERRLGPARALLGAFARANPQVVEGSFQSVRALGVPEECSAAATARRSLPPPDARARVDALSARLDEARALRTAGRAEEALARVKTIVEEARAIGYRPLQAEASLLLGYLIGAVDRPAAAERPLLDAAWAAEAAGDDFSAEQAWINVYLAVGGEPDRQADADRYYERASALIERLGGRPNPTADLALFRSQVLGAQGKYAEALASAQRALAIYEEHIGPDAVVTMTARTAAGRILAALGRYDEAAAAVTRAIADAERALGPEHPLVGRACIQLGYVRMRQGRLDEALPLDQRAVAIYRRSLGEEHLLTAAAWAELGGIQGERGAFADAEASLRKALAIKEKRGDKSYSVLADLGEVLRRQRKLDDAAAAMQRALAGKVQALGPEHVDVGLSHVNLGDLAFDMNNDAVALDHYRTALTIFTKGLGEAHLYLGYPLRGIGMTLLRQGDARGAIAPLERALAIFAGVDNPEMSGGIEGMLARALWATGQRERARASGARARATLARAGAKAKQDLDALDAWLLSVGSN